MTPFVDTARHQTEITDKHGMVLILGVVALNGLLVVAAGIALGLVEAGCVIAAEAIVGVLFWIAFWSGRAR